MGSLTLPLVAFTEIGTLQLGMSVVLFCEGRLEPGQGQDATRSPVADVPHSLLIFTGDKLVKTVEPLFSVVWFVQSSAVICGDWGIIIRPTGGRNNINFVIADRP